MSLLPRASADAAPPVGGASVDRLSRVLAAGLAVRPTRPTAANRPPKESPAERAVRQQLRAGLPDLPYDAIRAIAEKLLLDDPCSQLEALCGVDTRFAAVCRDDSFWKLACEIRGYDRKDRTTGAHAMAEVPLRWKAQFSKWCGLRFERSGAALKAQVKRRLELHPTGAPPDDRYDRYGPINTWDVSRVTDMHRMFAGASEFNQPLERWDVSRVTDMSEMFAAARAFNQPLAEWNVSSVTNMSDMFLDARAFNHPLEGWDVSSVTDMSAMFFGALAFNHPLEGWDVSSVTDMFSMFAGARAFNWPLAGWGSKVSRVTNMRGMFAGADRLRSRPSWYVA